MPQARAAGDVHILEHSLVAAKMSVLRDNTTATVQFRRVLEQIAILLLTEVSKDWPTRAIEINTPLAAMRGADLARRWYSPQSCAQDLGCLREYYA